MFESDYDCFYSKLVFLKTVCPKITYFNKLTEFQKLIRLYMVAQREIQYVALANRRMYKDELSGKNRNVIMLYKRNIITENIVVVSLSLELYYFNLELGNCLFGSVQHLFLSNSKQPAVSQLQLIRFLSFTICYWFTNHNILRALLIRSLPMTHRSKEFQGKIR